MLLHILKNIADLPVTTSMVKLSGLGKLVGSIEKHRICSGPNEGNIREKVDLVKSSWKASVKARKIAEGESQPKLSIVPKREVPTSNDPVSPSAKRAKIAESSPKSSLSSLLNRMTGSNSQSSSGTSLIQKIKQANSNGLKVETSKPTVKVNGSAGKCGHDVGCVGPGLDLTERMITASPPIPAKKKKSSVRVKWADHFGGNLADSRTIEGENMVQTQDKGSAESWSDRKKRDREKEKKLLLTMKYVQIPVVIAERPNQISFTNFSSMPNHRKAKLLDEDDVENEPVVAGLKPTVPWKSPVSVLENPDAPKAQLNSMEVSAQNERMKTTVAVQYFSDQNVPSSPTPLSQIEQALDMTAQSSASVTKIPFFAAQQPEAAAPEPANIRVLPEYAAPPPEATTSYGATPEFVQALGLPLFLVGQNTQALQTLANSPGLLNSLVDSTGTYDQARLLSLVQTFSGPPAIVPPPDAPPVSYVPQAPPPVGNAYGSNGGYPNYGASSSYGASRSHASMRSSDEGNLHVSGYGPMITQADIIALFSQYVVVDEVVMKGSFCFVNTRDPVNAQRAKEALTGTLLGGQPLRINQAQRKSRDSASSLSRPGASTYGASSYGPPGGNKTQGFQYGAQPGGQPSPAPVVPTFQAQVSSVDDVRDSRGNAPTKNLFVAGTFDLVTGSPQFTASLTRL